MGKASRKKDPRRARQRKPGATAFGLVLTAVAVVGVVGIALSRTGEDSRPSVGPAIGEHYHAALGVNVCGEWKPSTLQYESAAGIHSHGDGFMHLHPFSNAGSGKKASVGFYLEQAGEKVTGTSIKLSDGTELTNGDECPNLGMKSGKVRWSVNGKEQEGDSSDYVPARCEEADPGKTCDVIALAFLPEGEEIGTPPVARTGQGPSDVPGGQPPPATGAPPPTSAPPNTTPPSTTPTTGP